MEQIIFDWTTLLTGIISALIGGFIGTYCGAFFINRNINKKSKDARKIAIKAIENMRMHPVNLMFL